MQINTELRGFSMAAIPLTAHPRYINSNYWEEVLNNIRITNDGKGRLTNPHGLVKGTIKVGVSKVLAHYNNKNYKVRGERNCKS